MADREKVVFGLECCTKYGSMCGLHCDGYAGWANGDIVRFNDHSAECPYLKCETGCVITLARDALELLKEQETGHWIYLTDCSNSGVYCSECNTKVFDNYPFKKKFSYFCPHCGTRMEGEVEKR